MWQAIVSGVTLGLILTLSVGPVIFTIIKQSLNNGHTGGFSFVAGVWTSDVVLVVISNAFSALVTDVLEYRRALGYVGSAFLVLMGVFYIFFKKVTLRVNADGEPSGFTRREMLRIFFSGFLINTLNPNVIFFWLSVATTFAVKYDLKQRILIFAICISLNILADVLKVVMAGKLRKRLTLHNIAVINKISGTILIGFGLALLYGVIFLSEKIQ